MIQQKSGTKPNTHVIQLIIYLAILLKRSVRSSGLLHGVSSNKQTSAAEERIKII